MSAIQRSKQVPVSCALLAAVTATRLFGASTWSGSDFTHPPSSNTSMVSPSNWVSGNVPASSATTDIIVNTGNTTLNQNIANPLSVRSITVSGSSNFTFTGNGYRFANAASTFALGSNINFIAPIDFAGSTTISSGYGTLSGLLSGSSPLLIDTASFPSITANVDNTFNGATTVAGYATINYGTTIALASPSYTVNGNGQIYSYGDNRLAGSPSMTFNTTVNGTPYVNLSGSQSVGALTFNGGGYFNVTTPTLNGNITVNSGFAQFNAGSLIDLGGGTRTINLVGANDLLQVSNALGNGAIVKNGPGQLALYGNGACAFTAPVQINAGSVVAFGEAFAQGANNGGQIGIFGGTAAGAITGSGSVEIYGVVELDGPNTYSGGTQIDYSASLAGSTASLQGNIVSQGGNLEVNQPDGSGTLNAIYSGLGYLVKSGSGRVVIGGTNTYAGGTYVNDGTLAVSSDTALGSGSIQVYANLEAVGTRTISNLFANDTLTGLTFVGSGDFNFTNTNAKAGSGAIVHNATGTTTVAGKFTVLNGASVTVNAGTLTLGDAASVNGFVGQTGSTLAANAGGSLKILSSNFISLPDVELNGGNLIVPNGYAIPLAAVLQGAGSVTGRIASVNGSTISASGNLAIGDSANVAGVNLDGELYTHQFAITLNDSNQAVVGSITNLGNGLGTPGTLNAPKGLVVNFGRNITGNGTINSINTLANAIIMNGDVNGDSASSYLNFTGYVKGVGTFNNVAFSGTYSPGFSPTLATVGNVIFTSMNVLEMEIGGLTRGSQYDGIDATGNLGLGGQLNLSLINGYTPSLGNQFNLFDGPTTGTFSSFNFAPLPAGLLWDTSLLYSQGIVQVVVPEPTTITAMVLGGMLLRRRR